MEDLQKAPIMRNTATEGMPARQLVLNEAIHLEGIIDARQNAVAAGARNGRKNEGPPKTKVPADACKNCGTKAHNAEAFTKEAREKHCKAYGKECNKCKKLHHFSSVCKAGSSQRKDKKPAEKPAAGVNAGTAAATPPAPQPAPQAGTSRHTWGSKVCTTQTLQREPMGGKPGRNAPCSSNRSLTWEWDTPPDI